jgi:hypothetical protein
MITALEAKKIHSESSARYSQLESYVDSSIKEAAETSREITIQLIVSPLPPKSNTFRGFYHFDDVPESWAEKLLEELKRNGFSVKLETKHLGPYWSRELTISW